MFACEFQPLVDAPLANRAADQLMAQAGCGGITVFLVSNTHQMPFFVCQNWLIDGTWQRSFGDLARGAHIQYLRLAV